MSGIPTDEQVKRGAAELMRQATRCRRLHGPEDYEEMARAVLVAVGPMIAAQALRDAAGALVFDLTAADGYWAWLRRRADVIEKEAGR